MPESKLSFPDLSAYSREELIYIAARLEDPLDETPKKFRLMQKYLPMDETAAKDALSQHIREVVKDWEPERTESALRELTAAMEESRKKTAAQIVNLMQNLSPDEENNMAARLHKGMDGALRYYIQDKDASGQSISRRKMFTDGDMDAEDFVSFAVAEQKKPAGAAMDIRAHLRAAENAALLLNSDDQVRTILKEIPKSDGPESRTRVFVNMDSSVLSGVVVPFAALAKRAPFERKPSLSDSQSGVLANEAVRMVSAQREKNSAEALGKLNEIRRDVKGAKRFDIRMQADVQADVNLATEDSITQVPILDNEDIRFILKYYESPARLNPDKYTEDLQESFQGKKRYVPGLHQAFQNRIDEVFTHDFINDSSIEYEYNLGEKDNLESERKSFESALHRIQSSGKEMRERLPRAHAKLEEAESGYEEFRKADPEKTRQYDAQLRQVEECTKRKDEFERQIAKTDSSLGAEIADLREKVIKQEAEIKKLQEDAKKEFPDYAAYQEAIQEAKSAIDDAKTRYYENVFEMIRMSAYLKGGEDLREAFLPYKHQLEHIAQEQKTAFDPERVNPSVLPILDRQLMAATPARSTEALERIERMQQALAQFSSEDQKRMFEASILIWEESKGEDFDKTLTVRTANLYANSPDRITPGGLFLQNQAESFLLLSPQDAERVTTAAQKVYQARVDTACDALTGAMHALQITGKDASRRLAENAFLRADGKLVDISASLTPEAKGAVFHQMRNGETCKETFAAILHTYSVDKQYNLVKDNTKRAYAFASVLAEVKPGTEIDARAFAKQVKEKYEGLNDGEIDFEKIGPSKIESELKKADASYFSPADIKAYAQFIASKDFDPSILQARNVERAAEKADAQRMLERMNRPEKKAATPQNGLFAEVGNIIETLRAALTKAAAQTPGLPMPPGSGIMAPSSRAY